MEMVAEAKVLIVNQVCDKCGEGIMEFDTKSIQICRTGLPHKCDKCGYVEDFPVKYPYHRLVPIEVLREPVGREIAE